MAILSLCEPIISVNTPFSKFLPCRAMKNHGLDLVETFANLHRVSLSPNPKFQYSGPWEISRRYCWYDLLILCSTTRNAYRSFCLEQIGFYGCLKLCSNQLKSQCRKSPFLLHAWCSYGADWVPKHGHNRLYGHLTTQIWNWVDLVTRCRLNGHRSCCLLIVW